MLHTIVRYRFFCAAGLALIFLTLTFIPMLRAKNAELTACGNEPSAQCLTDLGVEFAMGTRSFRASNPREIQMLAQIGRIEDAFALGTPAQGQALLLNVR